MKNEFDAGGKINLAFSMFKITAFSAWQRPQIFFRDSFEKANELRKELKEMQYLVEIDEVNDEESGEI